MLKHEHEHVEERHRIVASWIITLLLYALVILISLILNIQILQEPVDKPGPVMVKMGNPEALDLPVDTPAPIVEPSAEPEAVPTIEPTSEPELVLTPEPKANATSAPSKKPSPTPTPKSSAKPSTKPSISPKPSPTIKTSTKPSNSPSSSTEPLVTALLQPSASPQASAKPVQVRGSEKGNAHETTFENATGHIGRALYAPIYLYMPLPSQVLGATYDRMAAGPGGIPSLSKRKTQFENWYVRSGSNWQLKTDPNSVPFDERPDLWTTLEDAGYDTTKADYKLSRKLNPVVLEFTLAAPEKGKATPLKSVRITSSSGDGSIDDAVVYGFRRAAYANDTGRDVNGRFIYRFDGGR